VERVTAALKGQAEDEAGLGSGDEVFVCGRKKRRSVRGKDERRGKDRKEYDTYSKSDTSPPPQAPSSSRPLHPPNFPLLPLLSQRRCGTPSRRVRRVECEERDGRARRCTEAQTWGGRLDTCGGKEQKERKKEEKEVRKRTVERSGKKTKEEENGEIWCVLDWGEGRGRADAPEVATERNLQDFEQNEKTMFAGVSLCSVRARAIRLLVDRDLVLIPSRAENLELLWGFARPRPVHTEEALDTDAIGAFLSCFRAGCKWRDRISRGRPKGVETERTLLEQLQPLFRLRFTVVWVALLRLLRRRTGDRVSGLVEGGILGWRETSALGGHSEKEMLRRGKKGEKGQRGVRSLETAVGASSALTHLVLPSE
jgi:hypothetical protein